MSGKRNYLNRFSPATVIMGFMSGWANGIALAVSVISNLETWRLWSVWGIVFIFILFFVFLIFNDENEFKKEFA